MTVSSEKTESSCSGGCSRCGSAEQPKEPAGEGLAGWWLTVSAVAAFLMPLALAVAGAAMGGGSETRQFMGATIGLGVGLTIGLVVSRLLGSAAEDGA